MELTHSVLGLMISLFKYKWVNMFTDNPTIPAQLEVLLDVMHLMRDKKTDFDALKKIIQPKGLPDVTDKSEHLRNHINAALELGLVELDSEKNYKLSYKFKKDKIPKKIILEAFDEKVLSSIQIEKWAARVYAYLIVQDKDCGPSKSIDQELFSKEFMDKLPISIGRENPMNGTKYSALIRWYCYSGMGWIDPSGCFIPDPTERIRRQMNSIFKENLKLDIDDFMSRLTQVCPELDGGFIFKEVTGTFYNYSEKRFTRALATALWHLHDEKNLRLHCPNDTMGWHLTLAGEGLVHGESSNRVNAVEKITKAMS